MSYGLVEYASRELLILRTGSQEFDMVSDHKSTSPEILPL